MARKKRPGSGVTEGWLTTFADMLCLLLCFFAILFNPITEEETLAAVAEYFSNMGMGYSLTVGQMHDSANTLADMPSQTRGRALADALRRATTLFNPQIQSNQVRVTQDERGVIISFASDVFFNSASARLNIEQSRHILLNLAILLNSPEVAGRKYRIEGHTDNVPIDPSGPWISNWQLSTERALSVLYFLTDLGVPETRAQVSGFGSTVPLADERTSEGQAFNRRVDVIIVDDAHL